MPDRLSTPASPSATQRATNGSQSSPACDRQLDPAVALALLHPAGQHPHDRAGEAVVGDHEVRAAGHQQQRRLRRPHGRRRSSASLRASTIARAGPPRRRVVSSLRRVTARETRRRCVPSASPPRSAPPAAEVWARAATIAGVNAELAPFARMTTGEGDDPEGALGRSWILLAGVLPVDYDDLRLEAVEAGRGFRERSVLGSCSAWHHDRTLHPLAGGGTRVVDDVAFTPRLAPPAGCRRSCSRPPSAGATGGCARTGRA